MVESTRELTEKLEHFRHRCGELKQDVKKARVYDLVRQASVEEAQALMNKLTEVEAEISSLVLAMDKAAWVVTIEFDMKCMGTSRSRKLVPTGGSR